MKTKLLADGAIVTASDGPQIQWLLANRLAPNCPTVGTEEGAVK